MANDVRNVARDSTIAALVIVPVIFLVLLRFGFPRLESAVPEAGDYRAVALSMFCAIAATFPAFMLSSIMLDEKDQQLFTVFRVLPVAPGRLIAARVGVVAALGLVNASVVLFGSGLGGYSAARGLLLAALCALVGPVALLVAVSLADNKVEGLALFKGIFFVVFAAAAVQGSSGSWRHVLAIIPTYWTSLAFGASDDRILAWTSVAAVVAHGALAVLVLRLFRRRAF